MKADLVSMPGQVWRVMRQMAELSMHNADSSIAGWGRIAQQAIASWVMATHAALQAAGQWAGVTGKVAPTSDALGK